MIPNLTINSETRIKKFQWVIKKYFIVERQIFLRNYFLHVFYRYIKYFHIKLCALMGNLKPNTSCFNIRFKSLSQNLLWNELILFWIFYQVHPVSEWMLMVNIKILKRFFYQRKSAYDFPCSFRLKLICWLDHRN